jgi:hypothetical protein
LTAPIVVSTGVFLLLLTLWHLAQGRPTEPIYEGRTLTEWLSSPESQSAPHKVDFVILYHGDECVPVLKRILLSRSRLERSAYQAAPLWVKRWWTRPERRSALRCATAKAAETLRGEAMPLVPDLIFVLGDSGEPLPTRIAAWRALQSIGADHGTMLTVMSNLVADPEPLIAASATKELVQRQYRRDREEIEAFFADHVPSNHIDDPPAKLEMNLAAPSLSLDAK